MLKSMNFYMGSKYFQEFFIIINSNRTLVTINKIINKQIRMNNENNHPIRFHSQQQINNQNLNQQLATLLVIITTFQQKIEILRIKLAGHPNFSPQLYYKQIDRLEKGYIEAEDIITFIKKSKPTFNIDLRYLRSLFSKLNNNQSDNVPKDRLTYFGYLNIIKPYFDSKLAKELLQRDSIAMGTQIDLVAKKLLEDLICTLYACVAEHERAKQLIILGDIQQGGSTKGTLYNIYELLSTIKKDNTQAELTSLPTIHLNIKSNNLLPASQSNIRSQTSINENISLNSVSRHKLMGESILDVFYKFIVKNSQFQVNRQDMKYLLAYLMCHEFMVEDEKQLTRLFMPVTANILTPTQLGRPSEDNLTPKYYQQVQIKSDINFSMQNNFLNYVHPNSISREKLQTKRKTKEIIPSSSSRENPQIKVHPVKELQRPKLIDTQPRALINANNSTIQTPLLQKFLRESKVLKNMSRYQPSQVYQEQSEQQSAFIQQSNYLNIPQNNHFNHQNNNQSNKIGREGQKIGKEHRALEVSKDFDLQQVLSNSNLHRSQYYQNLSQRNNIKDQPLKQPNQKNFQYLQQSGILNQFMRR